MSRRFLPWTGLGALGAVLILAGCEQVTPPPSTNTLPPATVRAQTVENKKRVATEEAVGTVRAKLQATIQAKISGRIIDLPVVAGQAVKSGDLLAQLDAGEIQARLEQAKAIRDQAQSDRKRYENLLKQNAVTQQEYDAVESRYRVAAASVTEAETMLNYARVEAPFDGVISRKFMDVGDLASPGRPLLLLEAPKALRFETDISEGLIGQVRVGQKMNIRVSPSANPIEGTVSEVAPTSDPNSRTFRVKLDVPTAPGLRIGQFGRAEVPVGESVSARVPVSAVVRRGQMEMVFVIKDQAAQLRLVKTGRQLGDEIEILSGLNPGEQVAITGAETLIDGQPVRVEK